MAVTTASPPRRLRPRQREAIEGYLFVLPWFVGFLIFTAGPLLASLYFSFTEWGFVDSPVFVGLKDANLILAAADLARVPLPSLDLYRERLLGAIAHGDGGMGQAVLAREQARACGLE